MHEAKLLYQVVGRFAAMRDLDKLSTHDMGYVFEHIIRKFYEDANARRAITSLRGRSSG